LIKPAFAGVVSFILPCPWIDRAAGFYLSTQTLLRLRPARVVARNTNTKIKQAIGKPETRGGATAPAEIEAVLDAGLLNRCAAKYGSPCDWAAFDNRA
jgi:hypothetical protein